MKVLAWSIRACGFVLAAMWHWFRARSGRHQVVIAAVVVLLTILSFPSSGDDGSRERTASGDKRAKLAGTLERVEVRTSDTRASELPPPEAPSASEVSANEVLVTSVTDGDTLRMADGRSVRLAQVDAPETGECFGSQSTAALWGLVDGRAVELRRPPTGPEQDRYGRTLADVWVGGISVNQRLVEVGAAEWYQEYAREDVDLAARLDAAEREARAAGEGLWSACGAAAAAPPAPAERNPPTRSAYSSGSGCHTSYTGTCIPSGVSDADCAGGSGNGPHYVQESDIGVVGPDVFDLDRDGDGVGCES